MTITRMNKAIREALVYRVVDDVRKTREPALRNREHALVIRLVKARYGDDVFERCRALPEGWLEVHKQLVLSYNLAENLPRYRKQTGRHHGRPHFTFLPERHLSLSEYAPLPFSFSKTWDREELGKIGYDEVYGYFENATELYRDLENLETQVRATANAFTTVERLADAWPEGFALIPHEILEPVAVAGLPAPRIEDLNKRIAAMKEAA